jgi:hypothetical protein
LASGSDERRGGESADSLPSDDDFLGDGGTDLLRKAFNAKVAEVPTDFGREQLGQT